MGVGCYDTLKPTVKVVHGKFKFWKVGCFELVMDNSDFGFECTKNINVSLPGHLELHPRAVSFAN